MDETPVKKKRGRKPKIKEEKPPEEKVKKKRGRKPLNLSDINNTKIKPVKIAEDGECLVAHIPLSCSEDDKTSDDIISSHLIDLNNTNAEKYNDMNKNDLIEVINKLKLVISSIDKSKTIKTKYKNSNEFMEKNKTVRELNTTMVHLDNNIEKSKDIKCWWCCHSFCNEPSFLPDHVTDNVYHVFGYFCSLNCAQAYNYDRNDHKIWQRANLINLLYNEVNEHKKKIVPSPPRETLTIFGGFKSIEDFRKDSLIMRKDVRMIMPPMKSIIPLIEEDLSNNIYEYKSSRYIPISKTKIKTASDNLKLKRSKPLMKNKFSIEQSMGLKRKSETE